MGQVGLGILDLLSTCNFLRGCPPMVIQMELRPGCKRLSSNTLDRNLCARWRLCAACEDVRARRTQAKLARKLQHELDWADDVGWPLKVGVLTTTLPGKESEIRHADLESQVNYLCSRVTLPGHTGWHSMRGLNTKMKEWGVMGGSHHIEFTNSSGTWNCHMHSIMVGFEEDWAVPLKTCTKLSEWNDDGTMRLIPEKLPLMHRSNKRVLEPLGLGRIYTLDIATEDELDSAVRYAAKVQYVTKAIDVRKMNGFLRAETSDFLAGKKTKKGSQSFPRLVRSFGSWSKNSIEMLLD
jgi:hypothetical protein